MKILFYITLLSSLVSSFSVIAEDDVVKGLITKTTSRVNLDLTKTIVVEQMKGEFEKYFVDFNANLDQFSLTEPVNGQVFSLDLSVSSNIVGHQFRCSVRSQLYSGNFPDFGSLQNSLMNPSNEGVWVFSLPRFRYSVSPNILCKLTYFESMKAYKDSLEFDKMLCRGDMMSDGEVKCIR